MKESEGRRRAKSRSRRRKGAAPGSAETWSSSWVNERGGAKRVEGRCRSEGLAVLRLPERKDSVRAVAACRSPAIALVRYR